MTLTFKRLKSIPIRSVKIDGSFIQKTMVSQRDAVIVRSIISLAKELNLLTVAEGVETSDQVRFLEDNGCDQLQGFYYSKPLLPEEFVVFVQAYQQSAAEPPLSYGEALCERLDVAVVEMRRVLVGMQGYVELLNMEEFDLGCDRDKLLQVAYHIGMLVQIMDAADEDLGVYRRRLGEVGAADIMSIAQISHYAGCQCKATLFVVERIVKQELPVLSSQEYKRYMLQLDKFILSGLHIAHRFCGLLEP